MNSPRVAVRRAQDHDAGAVARLAALTFPLACPPGTSPETIAAHVAAHLTPRHVALWIQSPLHDLLVAESGGEAAGYALLVVGEPEGELERQVLADVAGPAPYVELSKIYVHPDQLGSGTAGALMSAAIDAASLHVPHGPVWLGTNAENTRAQAFYRKHGFAVVGRRTYDVGGAQHEDVVMLRATH